MHVCMCVCFVCMYIRTYVLMCLCMQVGNRVRGANSSTHHEGCEASLEVNSMLCYGTLMVCIMPERKKCE